MMETTPDRCPSAPSGESHRWRIPDQGVTGPARCRYCGAERLFPAYTDATRWDTVTAPAIEHGRRGAKAGNEASRQARAARKAAG